jgi:hypothetical protein
MEKTNNLHPTFQNLFETLGMILKPEPIKCDCEPLSNCCGAPIDTDILICTDCKEHSDIDKCDCETK